MPIQDSSLARYGYATLLLFFLLLLVNPQPLNGAERPTAELLDGIAKKFPTFDPTHLLLTPHPVKRFGAYQLTLVSSSQILPPPKWPVAYRQSTGKLNWLLLQPDRPETWNQLIKTTKIELNSKKKLARFPLTYIKIMAPGERPKWRFSSEDKKLLTKTSKDYINRGWQSQKTAKGYIMNFFSQSLSGQLFLWRMVVTKEGIVRKIKRLPLE